MAELPRSNLALPNVKVVNVVVSTKADRQIDIELLVTKMPHVIYEPENFPGLIYRRRDPKATIIMFSTGKIVSIGSRSEETARESIIATISEIMSIEREKIRVERITTENVAAISDIGCEIDIEKAVNCGIKVMYEPEQFPGVIYRVRDNLVALIFKSGKIISVGSKSEDEARSIIHLACKILEESDCCLWNQKAEDGAHE